MAQIIYEEMRAKRGISYIILAKVYKERRRNTDCVN